MEEMTPRTLILGALTSMDTTEPIRRTRNSVQIPTTSSSGPSVESNLSVERSALKWCNNHVTMATPINNMTPRTLIGGLLDAASVSKSVVIGLHKRKSKLVKSPATTQLLLAKKKRKSIGDNATPRTIIESFLREAQSRTPVEVPGPDKNSQPVYPHHLHGRNDRDANSDATSNGLPLVIPAMPEEEFIQEKGSMSYRASQENSGQTEHITNSTVNATKDIIREDEPSSRASLGVVSSDNREPMGMGDKMVSEVTENPQVENTSTDSDGSQRPLTLNASEVSSQLPSVMDTSADEPRMCINGETQASQSPLDGLSTIPEECYLPYVSQEQQTENSTQEESHPSRWRDLVTPTLPPMAAKRPLTDLQNTRPTESFQKLAKSRPNASRKTRTKNTSGVSSSCGLPSNLVKSILQHFSTARVSKEALSAVEQGSKVFFKHLSSDLMAYCNHAGRQTIELSDVELLMKRQGLITDKQSLYSLIESFLPLEYRQELIPVVQSGNRVVLK